MNAAVAFTSTKTSEFTVPLTSLDNQFRDAEVSFIKFDVEGFEKSVLIRSTGIVDRQKRIVMVEARADESDIYSFFTARGWVVFLPSGTRLDRIEHLRGNVFILHKSAHKELINTALSQIEVF